MLQYALIADLFQFAFHMVQIPNFAVEYASCFTVDVIPEVTALSPTVRRTYTFPFDQNISKLWFVTPKDFIPLLYWPHWPTEAVWDCAVFSTVVSWQKLCYISQLHRVFFPQWMMPYFSLHWFSCAVCFKPSYNDYCHYKTAWNLWSQTSFHAIKYIYIYI